MYWRYMRNIIWYMWAICLGLLSIWGSFSFAQQEIAEPPIDCSVYSIDLLWETHARQWATYEYTLSWSVDTFSGATIVHTVFRDTEAVESFDESSFSLSYASTGAYQIVTDLTTSDACDISTSTDIWVYGQIVLYIWEGSDVLDLWETMWPAWSVSPWTWKHSLYFQKIEVEWSDTEEQLIKEISQYESLLHNVDRLVIDFWSLWKLFESLGKVFSLYEVDMTSTDVYVIADVTQSYFRRLLSKYVTVAWLQKVYVAQKQHFWSLFTTLLVWGDPQQFDFVKPYSTSLEDSNKMYFLSYMTDYLLFNGFPLSLLSLVLLLPFVWLLISFIRQVVWLSVFGVYSPLLFAISMYVIGTEPSLLLLFAAAIAVILVWLLTQKVYLLYSPKVSLSLILYCICALCVWWAHQSLWLGRVDMSVFTNSFAVFPFVCMLYVARGVFGEKFLQFKSGRWISLVEFFAISFWVLYVFNSEYLQNLFLWNPELILVILVLNMLVWRFTWLQIFEYVRFFPLIRYYFDEEE